MDAIYIKQTSEEGEGFAITRDAWTNISPLWAPDHQKIAFVSIRDDNQGIYVSSFLGGVATLLLRTERVNISLRHWAVDGSAIFYEQTGNLFRLDLASGDSTKVTEFDESPNNDRYFSFSPDEKQIVFCDTRDGQPDIWIMPVSGGQATKITNDKTSESHPFWLPDGRRIIYNAFTDDLDQIYFISVSGGTPVKLTGGESSRELIDISADGGIYYVTSEKKSDIHSVDLGNFREAEIAAEPALEMFGDVSPDGKSVVYQTNSLLSPQSSSPFWKSAIVTKSTGGETRQLAGLGSDPHWLPDSRHISLLRKNVEKKTRELWLIDTVTDEPRLLTAEDVMSPSYSLMPIARSEISVRDFSRDGRVVYIDMQRVQNAKIGSVNGSEFTSLTRNDNPNVQYFSPLFSHDGSRIAIASIEKFPDQAQKPVRHIQVCESDTVKNIFSTADILRLIGWSSPTEIILATTKNDRATTVPSIDLVAVSLNRESRKLITLKDVYLWTLTISPDGKTLAYSARRDGRDDVWTLALTRAAEERKITSNTDSALFLTNLAFAANGKTIYFDKQEETDTISIIKNFE